MTLVIMSWVFHHQPLLLVKFLLPTLCFQEKLVLFLFKAQTLLLQMTPLLLLLFPSAPLCLHLLPCCLLFSAAALSLSTEPLLFLLLSAMLHLFLHTCSSKLEAS